MPPRQGTTLRAAVLLSLVLGALPAGAEFYRWTDASGREHFVEALHQVPPEHRAAADAAHGRPSGDGSVVNDHASPPPRSSAARAEPAGSGPAAPAPPAWDCAALRKEARKKQRVVERHRASVESNLRWADDISKSDFSRRTYEARAEEEERWLEKAEADLEAFRERNRRAGVPPGCLRD